VAFREERNATEGAPYKPRTPRSHAPPIPPAAGFVSFRKGGANVKPIGPLVKRICPS